MSEIKKNWILRLTFGFSLINSICSRLGNLIFTRCVQKLHLILYSSCWNMIFECSKEMKIMAGKYVTLKPCNYGVGEVGSVCEDT